MVLAEVLDRKDEIKKRIKELRLCVGYLASSEQNTDVKKIDNTILEIYKLLEDYQRKLFLIDKVNKKIELKIGESTVMLADAVKLRTIVQIKLDVLNELINVCVYNEKSLFNIIELMKNRDKLLNEYYVLNKIIKSKDWTVELTE